MTILTLDEAVAHCRVDFGYPVEQLLPYMDAAESYVIAHLNRSVFESQADLDQAQDDIAAKIGAASDAYQSAVNAANQVGNLAQRQAMIDVAKAKYSAVTLESRRDLDGVVLNGAIRAAMLLTLGNLFANREADVVGVTVAALPAGVPELLRPYRMVQMP